MPLPIDRHRCLSLPLMLAALSGCAQWPVAEPSAATAPTAPAPAPAAAARVPAELPPAAAAAAASAPTALAEPTARLLALQERLRTLNAAELARESAAREAPADAPTSVEQALVLLQLRALSQAAGAPANGELARVQALLEPVARQPSPWQATAKLLGARVAEQRRLEDQLAQAQQQLREQQRRNEQLSAQIEALRAIERSLGATRPVAPGNPAASR
jgi:hypothetical protein